MSPAPLPACLTVPTPLGEVAVHCRGALESDRPVVLLLHANPGDSRDYDAVVPALAEGHRVLAVDWPGYGDSPAAAPELVTADGLVEVAEQVLDALAGHGVHRMSVVGNSVGGFVAYRLAERRPRSVAALVLVDPAGFTRQSVLTRWFCRSVMGRPRRARHLVAPLARAYLGRLRTDSVRATYARARRVRHDARHLAVHCAIWRSFAEPGFDLTATTSAAVPTVPVLLLWGRRDPVLPAAFDGRRARRVLAGTAESVILPTGHEPYNEYPEAFLAHVLPFLAHALTTSRDPGPGAQH